MNIKEVIMDDKRVDELMEIIKEYNYIMNIFMSFMLIPDWIVQDDKEVK